MANLLPILRRKKKIKQIDLARALNISPSYLCKVEKGIVEPSDTFKSSCAEFLEETIESVFPMHGELKDSGFTERIFINNLWTIRQNKNIKQNNED